MKKKISTLFIFFCSCIPGFAEDTRVKDYILVISSINFEEARASNLYREIVTNFSSENIDIRAEELSIPMITTLEEATLKRENLLKKHPVPPKIVVYIGDPGWLLCRPLFEKEWKDIPTIICASRDSMPVNLEDVFIGNSKEKIEYISAEEIIRPYNLTILKQPSFIKETVELIQQLLPDLEKIAFISDERYISFVMRQEMKQVIRDHFPSLQLDLLSSSNMTTEDLLDTLIFYDNRVGVIYFSWFMGRQQGENRYLGDNIQQIIHAFSKSPVFTLSEVEIDKGAFAGGYFISSEEFGQFTIQIIQDILRGKPARHIPIQNGGCPRVYLNHHHLEHHHVDAKLFPRNAVYYQMPLHFFQRYKIYFVIGLAIIMILGVLILMRFRLLLQKTRQKSREFRWLSQYRRLVDNMPVIYMRKQLLTNEEGHIFDFIFIDVNLTFEDVFKTKRKQVVGKRLSEVDVNNRLLDYMLDRESGRLASFVFPEENNKVRYFDKLTFPSTDKDVWDVFFIDRTDEYLVSLASREHQLSLEQLNRKYDLVLEATGLFPWAWNLQTHVIEYDTMHASGKKETGFPGKKILSEEEGMSRIHPDDSDHLWKAYDDLIAGRVDVVREKYRTSAEATREYFWIESFVVVGERDESGRPIMLVGSTLIINDQKKLEEDLVKAKEQAEASKRLKSDFLDSMSREIRVPLNTIMEFSNALTETTDEDEKKKMIQIIKNNNTLLLQLIGDILDLSKIEAGVFECVFSKVNLNVLLREIEQAVRLRLKHDAVSVEFVECQREAMIYSDANRLMQVMNYLIANVLKFTRKGSIHFGCEERENGKIYFFVTTPDTRIPTDEIQKIFGYIEESNPFRRNTGLGRSICESIVKRLGGEIGVNPVEGEGSTFWFSLPKEISSMGIS